MTRPNPRRRKASRVQNSLTDLVTTLSQLGTGGSYLSSYGTQAYTNNYTLLTLNRVILTYMYTTNGIFQTAIQLPVQDAISKGIQIQSGELSNEDIDLVLETWDDLDLWTKILDTWTWVRLFGGGALLVNSYQDPKSPLNIPRLQGQGLAFYDIDRWQIDAGVTLMHGEDIFENEDVPIVFHGTPIHASRFMSAKGKRAPHRVRQQLHGWGMSEGERMIRSLNLYTKTQDVLFEILDESKVDVWYIKDLANKLATAGGTSAVTRRIQAANQVKNYVNGIVMDIAEKWEQKQLGFTGLAEVMQQNRIGIAADLRMPLTKLFGLSASGFNTGESDLENYNQMIESDVRRPMSKMIRKCLKIIMGNLFGYVPSFRFEWPSLRELSAQEQEQVSASKANTILQFFDRNLLTGEEAAQEAKRSGLFDVDMKAEQGLLQGVPKTDGEEPGTPKYENMMKVFKSNG